MAKKKNKKLVLLEFVIETEMSDDQLDEFTNEMLQEVRSHLLDTELCLTGTYRRFKNVEAANRHRLKDLIEAFNFGAESTSGEDP